MCFSANDSEVEASPNVVEVAVERGDSRVAVTGQTTASVVVGIPPRDRPLGAAAPCTFSPPFPPHPRENLEGLCSPVTKGRSDEVGVVGLMTLLTDDASEAPLFERVERADPSATFGTLYVEAEVDSFWSDSDLLMGGSGGGGLVLAEIILEREREAALMALLLLLGLEQ